MKPTVFMYSGQGAQYFQMGRDLYDEEPVFRAAMERCSALAEQQVGQPLIDIIYGPGKKSDPFERTLHTHPAIFSLAYSLTELLKSRGLEPDYLLGYSLGEYTAAVVSGSISLEEGMDFIMGQAQLLEAHTPNAGMMAVLADPSMMTQRPALFGNCHLAGHNFANHFVVTGYKVDLSKIEASLTAENITCQILPVSHGFHSPIIDSIEGKCKALLQDFAPPALPVISCRTTEELGFLDEDHLWSVVRGPIRFYEAFTDLQESDNYLYVDVGPAGTLSTFAKYILPRESSSLPLPAMTPFGNNRGTLKRLFQNIQ